MRVQSWLTMQQELLFLFGTCALSMAIAVSCMIGGL